MADDRDVLKIIRGPMAKALLKSMDAEVDRLGLAGGGCGNSEDEDFEKLYSEIWETAQALPEDTPSRVAQARMFWRVGIRVGQYAKKHLITEDVMSTNEKAEKFLLKLGHHILGVVIEEITALYKTEDKPT